MRRETLFSPALAVALALAASAAAAADCSGDSQGEMNRCAAASYRAADARLTRAYARLERTPQLIAAERAWIAYRDAECAYEAGVYQGGSIQPLIRDTCLTQMTDARSAILERLAEDEVYRRP